MKRTVLPIQGGPSDRASDEGAGARPNWFKRGSCRGLSIDVFFDPDREDEVKAVCEGCPVIGICLEYALGQPDLDGFWAGTSVAYRRQLRQMATRASTATRVRESLDACA